VAKRNSGRRNAENGDPESQKSPGRREPVTLLPFQWWQIDSLKGIYAPTVPEILRRIILEWLTWKADEIEKQKREHKEFLEQQRHSE
jgi:hypothetical protein